MEEKKKEIERLLELMTLEQLKEVQLKLGNSKNTVIARHRFLKK